MKRTGIIAVALCGLCAWPLMAQKRFQLQSPDQQVRVEVTMAEQIATMRYRMNAFMFWFMFFSAPC